MHRTMHNLYYIIYIYINIYIIIWITAIKYQLFESKKIKFF